MNYEKNSESLKQNSIQSFWNDRIMERFIKANLFIISCVAAGLLLIVYLGAFSCEVSWILEARGDLPFSSYILCTQFFIVFVATTILIHGLVTGLSWGLFAWSVVIGLLSIPELIFVMIMTTQHWGLQSVHGLTELISYLIRLVINCFALICVIPTGLRWRRETQVLSQLQDLATRLQLQTPPPSVPMTKNDSRRSSQRVLSQTAFENGGFQVSEPTPMQLAGSLQQGLNFCHNNNQLFGSQNEFNASIFLSPYASNLAGIMPRNANRAQSLMDLRCTLPGMYNPRYVLDTEDKNGKYFNITIDDLKNNMQDTHKSQTPSIVGSGSDPIYCSIEPSKTSTPIFQHHQHHHQQQQHHRHQQEQQQQQHHQQQQLQQPPKHKQHKQQRPPQKLSRNCISLENLDGITKVQNDLAIYGHNLLQNYTQQQQYYLAMLSGYIPPQTNLSGYRHSTGSSANIAGDGFTGTVLAQPLQRRNSHQMQYYGGFGYGNYTNPYITANSRLSLGNESDDYRKYRDVAL